MNIIPKSNAEVTNLALLALAGAEAHGADVRLRHNSASHLRSELLALVGDPHTPALPGAQARLDAQLRLMRETYAALQNVLRAARTFCFIGIGFLRPKFGQLWNSDWQAAGFHGGSLAVPAVPLALLLEFRAFLTGNPDASAEYGFTAEDAQRHIDAIQSATLARENARGGRWSIKRERDTAFRKLRKRLSFLRAELALLLSPTDDRWYAFGFRRPADGKSPEPVRGLTVTPIAARKLRKQDALSNAGEGSSVSSTSRLRRSSEEGEIGVEGAGGSAPVASGQIETSALYVQWRHSTRAESYRVSWRFDRGMNGAEMGNAGDEESSVFKRSLITADEQVTLVGIPTDTPVVISVTARNQTGETLPTEVHTVFSMP